MTEAETTARNWSPKIKDMGDRMVGLTVLEAKELGEYLEAVHGIQPAAAAVAMAMPGAGAAAPEAEEKTSFDVILTGFGDKKIQVIKAVRTLTSLGLKEAKELVESAPKAIKENVEKEEADKIKAAIEEAGGTVELK